MRHMSMVLQKHHIPGSNLQPGATYGGSADGLLHYSTWTFAGNPGAGAVPATGSGTSYNSSSPGAMPFENADPVYLGQTTLVATGNSSNLLAVRRHIYLIDRLVANSGCVSSTTTEQTINSVSLPRHTSGVGVWAALEFYGTAATGNNFATVLFKYVNQDGINAQFTTSLLINADITSGLWCPLLLAPGDTGVRQARSITISGAGATAVDCGVTLYKQLAHVAPFDNLTVTVNSAGVPWDRGLPEVTGACLQTVYRMYSNASTPMQTRAHITLWQAD